MPGGRGCGGLPGVDEVLGEADVGGGPCDGDLPLRGALHGVGDLDLRARHLANLVYFGALPTDDAAYELEYRKIPEMHFTERRGQLNAKNQTLNVRLKGPVWAEWSGGNIDEKWIDVGGGFNDSELCNYVGQLWPIVQWIKVD